MKTGVKSVIIFLSGAAVGGSTAAFFMHKWAKKKYFAASEDRVKSLEEYIDRLQAEKLVANSGYVSDADEKTGPNIVKPKYGKQAEDDSDTDVRTAPTYVDYTQYSKGPDYRKSSAVDDKFNRIAAELEHPVDSDEDEEEDEDIITEEEKLIEQSRMATDLANNSSGPIQISYGDFGSIGYLDEVQLYFYQEDQTLVTEDEEIIPDVNEYIGDILHRSGFDRNSESAIYVRNYRRSTDYAIDKVFGAYSEKDVY